MKKQVFFTLAVISFLLIGTAIAVLYGMGYRFSFGDRGRIELSGTGLLVTTSIPDGASVFINGNLTTATDNTINLAPGEYTVKIYKEGYFPWEKKIKVQKEIVSKADALLFPTAPKLESITANGAQNPVMDPSATKLAYTVASQSAPKKNGIYILDMSNRPILTLQSASTQIADNTESLLSDSMISWSPDGRELVATVAGTLNPTTYLLQGNTFNQNPQNITATLPNVANLWNQELQQKNRARVVALKPQLKSIIQTHFDIIRWSPDDLKILYQASESGTIPVIIKPRIIGHDSTPEQREIEKGSIYVYDIKDDKNYKIDTKGIKFEKDLFPLKWFPDSNHLIFVNDKKIDILDFDGTNATTIYAGPFIDNYVFPWTNESKIVILTNLGNSNTVPNLYTIGLK